MNTLAEQLSALLRPRLEALQPVAEAVGVEINRQMLANTQAGRSWQGADYVNTYSDGTAKKKGGPSPVTLRDRDFDLETVHVSKGGANEVELRFAGKGDIFYLHHHGRARGGKIRTIFPKEVSQVPPDVRDLARGEVRRVLSGQ